jgi:DNA-binding transcriptional ArsR family regulator
MANKTATFLAAIPAETKAAILGNIAKHYGITESLAYREVIDPDAEHLLDYVTGPQRAATHALMLRHGAM